MDDAQRPVIEYASPVRRKQQPTVKVAVGAAVAGLAAWVVARWFLESHGPVIGVGILALILVPVLGIPALIVGIWELATGGRFKRAVWIFLLVIAAFTAAGSAMLLVMAAA